MSIKTRLSRLCQLEAHKSIEAILSHQSKCLVKMFCGSGKSRIMVETVISQNESMQTLLKDFTKRMTTQIEGLAIPSLDRYLEPKYAYVKDRLFKCDICDDFNGKSKQALSAHKRGCKKKHSQNALLSIETDV